MNITGLKFDHFTAFNQLEVSFTPGINIFVGANGTGKTHILKATYAACDITRTKENFAEKLVRIFMPTDNQLGRLVHRQKGTSQATIEIQRHREKLRISFSNHAIKAEAADVKGWDHWISTPITSVYLPVKEMLANAPGFRSLYKSREIHFEEVYADIVDRAYLPPLRGPMDNKRERLLKILQKAIEGKVEVKHEEFYLRNQQGNLEFSLLAEGIRKLALLWLLIQNGTLLEGSVLFWDEPEANLNPRIIRVLVEILLELQRLGVQIFIATHDYVVLKEFDLQRNNEDFIIFHALYRDEDARNIMLRSTDSYLDIHPNAISDTFADLFDRDMKRALDKGGKE